MAAGAASEKVTLETLAAQVQALQSAQAIHAAAINDIGQQLAKALQDFAPVVARVSELSAGFQEANGRLAEAEATLAGMSDQAGMAERVAQMGTDLEQVKARLTGVETTRARSGRLGARLTGIEEALAKLAGTTPPTGGTQ